MKYSTSSIFDYTFLIYKDMNIIVMEVYYHYELNKLVTSLRKWAKEGEYLLGVDLPSGLLRIKLYSNIMKIGSLWPKTNSEKVEVAIPISTEIKIAI